MATELIGVQKLSKKMQTFYDAKGPGSQGGSNTIINQFFNETNSNAFTAVAGEDIEQGDAVYMASDQKVYRATALASDDAAAIGASPAKFLANAQGTFFLDGTILVPGADFDIGKPVFLRTDLINVSSDFISSPTVTEDIYQKIGVAISQTEFVLDIGLPFRIE